MIFFLILGMPVIPNAAGIYDNRLMNADSQKKENIKTNEMQFLNGNPIKASSDYEVELTSLLKKNIIKHKFENNLLSYNKFNSTDADSNQFIQVTPNSEIDTQALLETEMDWVEIKADLKDIATHLNSFDRSATKFLDDYLSQNINTNLVLVFNIKSNSQSNNELNFYEKKRLSNVIHQGGAHMKVEDDSYKLSSIYNNELNSAYQSGGEKKDILSIIYLWKMYSDTLVLVVSIIATLWLVIASLIKFLIWRG